MREYEHQDSAVKALDYALRLFPGAQCEFINADNFFLAHSLVQLHVLPCQAQRASQ